MSPDAVNKPGFPLPKDRLFRHIYLPEEVQVRDIKVFHKK